MAEHDQVSWNAMIVGYEQNGYGTEAFALFSRMLRSGDKPDQVTMIGVLSARSHVGMVEEGCRYFRSMTEEHGLVPSKDHYTSMVDLLGRAGHLQEAMAFIEVMPIGPDAVLWGSLLAACKVLGNLEIGMHVSEKLWELDSSNSGESENEDVEKRIKSLLAHLQAESAILDKIIYKSKNQHRRSFYFQYLLKVRRDVKLLQSADLEEILNFHFQVIDEKKPNNCAKKRKLSSVKYPFHMRLLGVARLLSQMVEPMVKAAIELSALLARSFFMRFSLLLCALLARLRVLVQQILLDVVSVFNMFSPSLQGSQSTVLSFRGIKVIREYHPSDNDVRALECVWETDKFVLLEKTSSDDVTDTRKHVGGGTESPLKSSNITYQTIEAFLGDDELGCQKDTEHSMEDLSNLSKGICNASADQFIEINKDKEVGDSNDDEDQEGSSEKFLDEGGINASPSPDPCQKFRIEPKSKVAFVSVGKLAPPRTKESGLAKKEVTADCFAKSANDKEDSLFSLLTAGQFKNNIF